MQDAISVARYNPVQRIPDHAKAFELLKYLLWLIVISNSGIEVMDIMTFSIDMELYSIFVVSYLVEIAIILESKY